jgi:hypothetical protein
MEPVTIIVTALSLGAATGIRTLAEQTVKDSYQVLKNLINTKYPDVGIDRLEKKPESKTQQAAIEEEMTDLGVNKDTKILQEAGILLEKLKNLPVENVPAIGIDLEKIEAASLKLKDIIATGIGVKVREGKFSGDIIIEQVRAGQENLPKI